VLDGLVDAGLTLVSADTNPLVLARADARTHARGRRARLTTRSRQPSAAGPGARPTGGAP
jgi:hypothetical protein